MKPSITLPVLALVFIFLCFPVGLVLSIVSLAKFHDAKGTEARTLSWVAFGLNIPFAFATIGVLAAIAIPSFLTYGCRSKHSEAKTNLKALYVAEESFHVDNQRYSANLDEIGFAPHAVRQRYTYSVVEASATSFRAEARGKDEMQGDVWTIDQTSELQQLSNACGR